MYDQLPRHGSRTRLVRRLSSLKTMNANGERGDVGRVIQSAEGRSFSRSIRTMVRRLIWYLARRSSIQATLSGPTKSNNGGNRLEWPIHKAQPPSQGGDRDSNSLGATTSHLSKAF